MDKIFKISTRLGVFDRDKSTQTRQEYEITKVTDKLVFYRPVGKSSSVRIKKDELDTPVVSNLECYVYTADITAIPRYLTTTKELLIQSKMKKVVELEADIDVLARM